MARTRVNHSEGEVLKLLARVVPHHGQILEIGSAWGYSAVRLAQGAKSSVKIHCIDSWTLLQGSHYKTEENREKFLKSTSQFPNITSTQSFSKDVDWTDPIHLLHIDGDHSFEGCLLDYKKFSPFITQGGWLVIHDYPTISGVRRVVDEVVIPSKLYSYFIAERFFVGRRKFNGK